jgi:ATP-dependent Clp protease ATP-binding subunit ClpA
MSTPEHPHVQSLPRRQWVTTRTHQVFALALRRAERLGHDDVTPVHIALGMLEEGHGAALAALHFRGVPLDALKDALEAELPPAGTPRQPAEVLSWSPEVERVLAGAIAEARQFGHDHQGTEHVLLAFLRDPTSAPARIVARNGVTYDDVRKELERIFNVRPGA